ncbi:DinB family protein [Oceanobacillus salinisoli]|uniref:DinB family protein n=1 Tax=Oceanobacillus salinisoli TaxID=2678611 RepID=UPI0012E30F80|nr:DinB family protein [Oceanobacillus salinisoli]
MEKTIFNYVEKVREITENSLKRIPEEYADIVPKGFNNNIRWNFGHIAFVQDKLTYSVLGEDIQVPKEFETYFRPKTKPADWEGTPPTFSEISAVLAEQKGRIRETIKGRLEEKLPTPFTNSAGVTFYTVGETLLFSCFHEGLHLESIKKIYHFAKNSDII